MNTQISKAVWIMPPYKLRYRTKTILHTYKHRTEQKRGASSTPLFKDINPLKGHVQLVFRL